jgi:ring-1,2-phenylacetyl-CoA epoxidase subunit PaaD
MASSLAPGSGVVSSTSVEELRALVSAIPDPEIPVLTLEDLGILRGIDTSTDGHAVIRITPTYSGCPAIDPIRRDVERAARAAGHADVEVRIELSPAWTTDCMTEHGRKKLREYGIAPPEPALHPGCTFVHAGPVACPRCGSSDTREVSRFGATPCQSQHVCTHCLEPFDLFKTLR